MLKLIGDIDVVDTPDELLKLAMKFNNLFQDLPEVCHPPALLRSHGGDRIAGLSSSGIQRVPLKARQVSFGSSPFGWLLLITPCIVPLS